MANATNARVFSTKLSITKIRDKDIMDSDNDLDDNPFYVPVPQWPPLLLMLRSYEYPVLSRPARRPQMLPDRSIHGECGHHTMFSKIGTIGLGTNIC